MESVLRRGRRPLLAGILVMGGCNAAAPDPDASGPERAVSTESQAVDSGFASAPDSAWVTLTGTTIVAFHPVVSNDSLEADEGLAAALDDLSYHLGSAMDSLLAMGVSVEYRGGDTLWLASRSRRLRFIRPADQPTVGYLFADTLLRWTALYGVRTHLDLVEDAREFQRTGAIVPR